MTSENGAVEDLTAVVTGASSGIGLAAAEELVRRGWRVALLGRDADRLAAAADRVRAAGPGTVEPYRCDFGSLADVRELAATLRRTYPTIDVLANNAGGSVATRQSTVDGHELTIQSNHLAHVLLSHELRENLRGGRIINTSSRVHHQGRLDPSDLDGPDRSYRAMQRYADAKQANILFTREATRRWPEILSTAFHPGVVRTRFGSDSAVYKTFYRWAPGLRTPAHGARTLVWLATVDSSRVEPGAYYADEKVARVSARATDPATAERLWTVSLDLVGLAGS